MSQFTFITVEHRMTHCDSAQLTLIYNLYASADDQSNGCVHHNLASFVLECVLIACQFALALKCFTIFFNYYTKNVIQCAFGRSSALQSISEQHSRHIHLNVVTVITIYCQSCYNTCSWYFPLDFGVWWENQLVFHHYQFDSGFLLPDNTLNV